MPLYADLIGRQSLSGTYQNQPKISENQFKDIKMQLLHKSKFKISKQQAQILHHQSNESNLLNIIESQKSL